MSTLHKILVVALVVSFVSGCSSNSDEKSTLIKKFIDECLKENGALTTTIHTSRWNDGVSISCEMNKP